MISYRLKYPYLILQVAAQRVLLHQWRALWGHTTHMFHICTGGIQVMKCMLHVTSRGAKAALKSSHVKVGQLKHTTRKVLPLLVGPSLIVLTLATVPTMSKFDSYKSLRRVRQIALADADKAFLCELFSHFVRRAKTTFGLMHICWWRSSSHILMLWLRMSVRGGEKSNPWECPSLWGVISCLTISLQYACPCLSGLFRPLKEKASKKHPSGSHFGQKEV